MIPSLPHAFEAIGGGGGARGGRGILETECDGDLVRFAETALAVAAHDSFDGAVGEALFARPVGKADAFSFESRPYGRDAAFHRRERLGLRHVQCAQMSPRVASCTHTRSCSI